MAHLFTLRVYYEDTDAGGIVYHASYLRFAERARTEMLREAGIVHRPLTAGPGTGFVVRRLETEFLRPAFLDDRLDVRTSVLAVGGASVRVEQLVSREEVELVRMTVLVACVGRQDGRPARLPAAARAAFEAFLGNED